MNIIRITEERMKQVLPANIQESDELSADAKKVLAVLLNYFIVLDFAKKNGYIYLSNNNLSKCAGVRNEKTLVAVRDLIESGLIRRQRGNVWKSGEKKMASQYYIEWDNLKKPIKKKPDFNELFKDFLNKDNTLEMPMGTTVIDTVIDIVKDTDIDLDIVKDLNSDEEKDIDEVIDVDVNKNLLDNSIHPENKLKDKSIQRNTYEIDNVTNNGLNMQMDYKIIEKEIKRDDEVYKGYKSFIDGLVKKTTDYSKAELMTSGKWIE